jgi:ABC-type multidrug transport system fused ATPase/permease subunit
MHFIYREAIFKFLKEKTVIFATNQMNYLPLADRVCFLQAGRIVHWGHYDDCLNNRAFTEFIASESKEKKSIDDFKEPEGEPEEIVLKPLSEVKHKPARVQEFARSKRVSWSRYWKTAQRGGVLILFIIICCFACSAALNLFSLWWVLQWATDITNVSLATNGTMNYTGPVNSNIYWVLTFGAFRISDSILVFLGTFASSTIFIFNMSKSIHEVVMKNLKDSTIYFYDVTAVGSILSR